MQIKEEFCGACFAIPLAFVGIGATRYGSKKEHKQRKKRIFWIGIVTIVISILIIIYYMYIKKCDECR